MIINIIKNNYLLTFDTLVLFYLICKTIKKSVWLINNLCSDRYIDYKIMEAF